MRATRSPGATSTPRPHDSGRRALAFTGKALLAAALILPLHSFSLLGLPAAAASEPIADDVPAAAEEPAPAAAVDGDAAQEQENAQDKVDNGEAGNKNQPASDGQAEDDQQADQEKKKAQARVVVEAARQAVAAAFAVAGNAVQPAEPVVSWTYFSDGVQRYISNGRVQEVRTDAIEQVSASFPNVRLARVMPGDSIVKLAVQYNKSPETLALLNRLGTDATFDVLGVVVLDWKIQLGPGQTLEQMANLLGTSIENLRKLNNLTEGERPKPGTEIMIPGQVMYHVQGEEGYLQVAQYGVQARQNIPFKPESVKQRQDTLGQDQTLAQLAEKHEVTEDFLRQMNGLAEDEEVEAGTMLLIEYSVEMVEGATVENLMQILQVDRERLFKINGWEDEDDVDLSKRLHIPIGERFRNRLGVGQAAEPPAEPIEFELTEIPDNEEAAK